MNAKLRSLIATIVLIVAMVLLLQQGALIAKHPVALVIQGLAIALMVWARLTFGLRSFHAVANPTAGGLVMVGPYKYWRHPIYAAVLFFVWAGVLGQGTWPTTVVVLIAVLATAMTAVRIHAEEELLRTTFPEYAAYAARTKRIVPYLF
jgi:protein-S-isoprenylcysteine O-methyltransferase Ste14